MCKVCRDKRAVAWYKRHPKVKQQVGAAYYKKNSKEIREYDLKRKGWTSQRVLECTAQQHNCCAICKEEFLETPCSDHQHVVPPIPRGLLCQFCNRGLGMFKDRSDLCKAAAEYLEKYNAVPVKGAATLTTCKE
jgi:hypothetical protein